MFGLILAAAAAGAVTTGPPLNPCRPAESCRYVGEFPLKDKQGKLHSVTVKQWVPYLANGRLTLFPGEVVSVTVSDKGPAVTAARVLTSADRDKSVEALAEKRLVGAGKEAYAPPANIQSGATFAPGKDSLRIAFLQTDGGAMMLRVASGYDKVLAYHAFIVTPGRDGQAPTSACSAPPGKLSIETWSPPIIAIQLADLQLQPTGAQIVCR